VATRYAGERPDVLLALHAEKNAAAIDEYRSRQPRGRLLVVLTGTDLYGPRAPGPGAQRSLALADRVVVLHPGGVADLPRAQRSKGRVILQSAVPVRARRRRDAFEVAVVGHLRAVKDPFRAALAARRLKAASRVRVLHIGEEIERGLAARARYEMRRNPRYRWLGGRSPSEARRLIARSRLLAVTSRSEGGANVISEALVAGVPVVSSAHKAAVALFGPRYPGLFPVGATLELRALLARCEAGGAFYRDLGRRCRELSARFTPERERLSWRRLLEELRRSP